MKHRMTKVEPELHCKISYGTIMRHLFISIFTALLTLTSATLASANCADFSGSTMNVGTGPIANWRTDYPDRITNFDTPWLDHSFTNDPREYMDAVLSQIRLGFKIDGDRLVGTGDEQWWASLWMDYGTSGRERRMGLTKERGPDTGDLSVGSSDEYQVWAIGFYNVAGATTFGDIFADPCDPSLPVQVRFPRNTVSTKFLFTDADPDEVRYLEGAPEFKALIDPTPSGGPAENRVETVVRLLQVDIAVKDQRAAETGWVFGTFGWVGPRQGDGLFDNLVPVSLQWGDDPGVYNREIAESWINPELDGIMYGWDARPTLGFNGRANGPADNIRSSCISCHSAGRVPRSSLGLLGFRFDMERDVSDPLRVIQHVNTWFTNRSGSQVFKPDEPSVSVLDYSLQLDAATFRLCRACRAGDLSGHTPQLCRTAGFYNRPYCASDTREDEIAGRLDAELLKLQQELRTLAPPRQ